MINIPFKENCIDFWSLDNTLRNEFPNKDSVKVENGDINFSMKNKCFEYTKFNNILKINPQGIESANITLIFQTHSFRLEDDEKPDCSLFSFVKDNKIKLCLNFEKCDDFFCINTLEQPMGFKADTGLPIKRLTEDRWITHVVVYDHDKRQIRYYNNAVLIGVIDIQTDMRMSDLYFNREHPCNGYIRNIAVYNCALTYEQIKKLLYHDYYGKFTVKLWLKFIEFIFRDRRALIPWI